MKEKRCNKDLPEVHMQSSTIHGRTLFPMLFSAASRRWRRSRGGKYIPTRTKTPLCRELWWNNRAPFIPADWEWGEGGCRGGKGNSNRCQAFGDQTEKKKERKAFALYCESELCSSTLWNYFGEIQQQQQIFLCLAGVFLLNFVKETLRNLLMTEWSDYLFSLHSFIISPSMAGALVPRTQHG